MVSLRDLRVLVATLALSVVAAACGNVATPSPAPSTSSSPPPAATSAATGSPAASTTAPSSTPTVPPETPAGSTAPEPPPSGAFACTYPFTRAATRTDAVAAVDDVRVGAHDAYDRIVFEFLGSGTPLMEIDQVEPPFTKDPSGLPLSVIGSAFIQVRLSGASGAGYAQPDGKATYTGPTEFNAGYQRLTALVEVGDFEGQFSWIAGLTGPMCYQVFELSSPARLVIDVRLP